MKNQITQFALVIIAFVAITFLMGYTRPAAEEAKQYILIQQSMSKDWDKKLEEQVNQKLSEGWRIQGGISFNNGLTVQAMVK